MQRNNAISITILAALLTGCATAPQSSFVATSSTPSSPVEPSTPPLDTKRVVNQVLPPMAVTASAPYLVDLTIHADDVWDRIRMGFAVPNMDSPLVVEQQAWFLSHPEFLQRAVDRSSHYLFHVVETLEKRHMPTELALLPFIESAYNPMAYSRAHASGMWQFIPSTGKNFNLKQDWWHDDRRDVVASTDAALNYLDTLYGMYGDWTLALASYNWGEGSVRRAIDRNQSAGLPIDYLSLNMPDETRTYYPRLQALKNIIANPQAFGISLPRIDNEPYFVAVATPRDIDVQTAAHMANMPVEDFRALNPAFNRPIINASMSPSLLLPADRAASFQEALANTEAPLVNWQAYRVKRGDRIEQVAAHYGMSVAALCEANSLTARDRLKPGSEILVALHRNGTGAEPLPMNLAKASPARSIAAAAAAPQPASVAVAPTDEEETHPVILRASYTPAASRMSPSVYSVKKGDTLFNVAQRFHLSVVEIKRLNHLRGDALQPGESLRVAEDARSVAKR
jgi:membrane-bound lytic murein transglycosylase D